MRSEIKISTTSTSHNKFFNLEFSNNYIFNLFLKYCTETRVFFLKNNYPMSF